MTELNIRQERFLNALLGSLTVDEACKKSNITRARGYKYLKDPVFLEKYRGLRRDAMQQVTTQLQQATVEAVDVLKEVMNNTEAPAASRVSSAKNVLDVAYRAFELDDLAEEVEKIKEQLEDT
ncbi:phage replication protein [Enterococcus italicus]|uniref:phage replication protein n=1 Tax=Enterococcus italicus TaxID=246144 RepID=UPI002073C766|nr:phage replication protein [Enterococcus italicus]MCM6880419.1 phage replication protein [Enterococcus italicus]MCM6930753.1 phage replication protein [Enterococcus italicus]